MTDVIEWLESADGEKWSKAAHRHVYQPLVSLLNDNEPSCLAMTEWRPFWMA
jgi:hypothetical protein